MKKFITFFTLAAFIIFSMYCSTMTRMEVKTAVEKKGTDVSILGVKKTSGEYIQFSKDQPGKIRGNTIEGRDINKRELVSIHWSEVEYIHIKELSSLRTVFLTSAILAGIAAGIFIGFIIIVSGID